MGVLLNSVPPGVKLHAMHEELMTVPGVVEVHDLHVWSITNGQVRCTCLPPPPHPWEVGNTSD